MTNFIHEVFSNIPTRSKKKVSYIIDKNFKGYITRRSHMMDLLKNKKYIKVPLSKQRMNGDH